MASPSTAKQYNNKSTLLEFVAAVRRPWPRAAVAAVPVLVAAVGLALVTHHYLMLEVMFILLRAAHPVSAYQSASIRRSTVIQQDLIMLWLGITCNAVT